MERRENVEETSEAQRKRNTWSQSTVKGGSGCCIRWTGASRDLDVSGGREIIESSHNLDIAAAIKLRNSLKRNDVIFAALHGPQRTRMWLHWMVLRNADVLSRWVVPCYLPMVPRWQTLAVLT